MKERINKVAMKSEQLKREFAKKWGYIADTWGVNDCRNKLLIDLNALIEAVIAEKMKDMYPKEFVEWAIQFTKLWDIGNEKAYTLQTKEGDINTLTLDGLYQYWKENER